MNKYLGCFSLSGNLSFYMALTKEQLDVLETALISEKAKIEAELDGLKEKLDFGSDVDHGDEETDETEEMANYLGIKNELDNRLQKIDRALDKIQRGEYGKCEKCEAQIEKDVLDKEPESLWCVGCKKPVNS